MTWRYEEQRKNGGWTIWKEIVGTAIGLLAIAVPVVVGIAVFAVQLKETVAVDRQRITALEYQSNVVNTKLDKISDKIDGIAQNVAAQGARERP